MHSQPQGPLRAQARAPQVPSRGLVRWEPRCLQNEVCGCGNGWRTRAAGARSTYAPEYAAGRRATTHHQVAREQQAGCGGMDADGIAGGGAADGPSSRTTTRNQREGRKLSGLTFHRVSTDQKSTAETVRSLEIDKELQNRITTHAIHHTHTPVFFLEKKNFEFLKRMLCCA